MSAQDRAEVAGDQGERRIRQLTVFLRNRVGALLDVTRELEAENLRIFAIAILDATDHAVLRIIVDDPRRAMDALGKAGYGTFETQILGVFLPEGKRFGIRRILSVLLQAELNVHYVFTMAVEQADGRQRVALALHVEESHLAGKILAQHGLELIGQAELR